MNKVSLLVDGVEYSNWESVSISHELNTIAGTFNLSITAKIPSSFSIQKFECGQKIQVLIDSDVVLTGYIEATPISYDATSVGAQVMGRSKTADLIDCTVMLKGVTTKRDTSLWEHRNKTTGVEVNAPDVSAISWNDEKLENIIAQLIKPYNIKLIRETEALDKKITFGANPTDTVLTALQNLTKYENIIFYGNENGDLVIAKKGNKKAYDSLELGVNVLKGDAGFDSSKKFSCYRVLGQTSGTDEESGESVSTNNADVTDDSVTRTRLYTEKAQGQGTKEICQKQAQTNKDTAFWQYYAIRYVVQGWRQSNGDLWEINSLVTIKDSFLGINNSSFLIEKVEFSLDNSGGMITSIDVVPPDGFTLNNSFDVIPPKTTKQKAEVKSNLSWLEH